MENFLTFDLESWYDSEFISEKKGEDFVLEGLRKTVEILDKYKVKATFFVTGEVLEKYPDEIRKLDKSGHEIASHSYEHKMLTKISNKRIKENILKSRKKIKEVIGKYPSGFRAPSWSVNKKLFWVFNFLRENKFSYSSSLFPIYMGAYGSWSFPQEPFYPDGDFLEIPPRSFNILPFRIPFCGGVYFRIWPKQILYFFIKKINRKGKRAVIYIHPWELCENIPRVKTSLVGRVISYYGLKTTKPKLEFILENVKFNSIENILKKDFKKKNKKP